MNESAGSSQRESSTSPYRGQASITGLSDDDLLDLADIFQTEPRGILSTTAWAEMHRRNLSL